MAVPPKMKETDLFKFRTKICERFVKHGKCDFADKCQYSHDLRWTRRPPWKYPYSPEMCPNVRHSKDERGRVVIRSTCWIQRKCKYAHTLEEQMYHPKIYKTVLCNQFQTDGWCERYYCPFAHSTNELRPIDSSFHPSMIINGSNQKESCPDAYLPSDRPHPKWRTQYLAQLESRKKKEWTTCSDDGDERRKELKSKMASKNEYNRCGDFVDLKLKNKLQSNVDRIGLPGYLNIESRQETSDVVNETRHTPVDLSVSENYLPKNNSKSEMNYLNARFTSDMLIVDGEDAVEIGDRYRMMYPKSGLYRVSSISGQLSDGVDLSNPSGGAVSIKYVISSPQIPTHYLKQYMQRWKHVDSDYVVNAEEVYLSEIPDTLDIGIFVVMNKVQGTLTSMLNVSQIAKHVHADVIPPEGLIEIIRGLLLGLNAIHRNHLVHGRINPSCIALAEDYTMKITPGIAGGLMSSLSMLCKGDNLYGATATEAILKNLLSDLNELNWIPAEIMIDFTHLADELKNDSGRSHPSHLSKCLESINWSSGVLESCDTWAMGSLIFYIVTGGCYPFGDIVSNPSIIKNMVEKKIINLYLLEKSPFLYSLVELILRNYQNPNCLTIACCHPLFWTLEDSILFLNSTTKLAMLRVVLEHESTALEMFYDVLDKEVDWVNSSTDNSYSKKFAAHASEYLIKIDSADKNYSENQTALQMMLVLKSYLNDKNVDSSEKLDTLHAIFIAHTSSFVKVYEYFMLSGLHSNTYHIDNIADAIKAYEIYWKSLEMQANVTLNILSGKLNNISFNRYGKTIQDIPAHQLLVKENNVNDINTDPKSVRQSRMLYRNETTSEKDGSHIMNLERSEINPDSMWVT